MSRKENYGYDFFPCKTQRKACGRPLGADAALRCDSHAAALASMIDIGVAGENRNTILIIAAVMATLAILRLCVY